MIPPDESTLDKRLAALPELKIDPRLSATVKRQALDALEERGFARLRRVWSSVLLPAALVTCAVVYAVDAAAFLEKTYVMTASR